jgi:excisionase family DNA binding protein
MNAPCINTAPGTQRDTSAEGLLTKFDIADRLKVAPRTVDSWMKKGRIPFLKIGKSCRFHWLDVLEKLNAYRVN